MDDSVNVNPPKHIFGLLRAIVKQGVHLVDLSDGQRLPFPADVPAVGLSLTPLPEPKRRPGMGFAPLAEPGEPCLPDQIELDGVLYLREGVPIPDLSLTTGSYIKTHKAETETVAEDDNTDTENSGKVTEEDPQILFIFYLRIGDDNSLPHWKKIMKRSIAAYNKQRGDSPEVRVFIRSTFKPPVGDKEKHRLVISCGCSEKDTE